MYNEEKFTLKPIKKDSNDLYLEGYGKRWGERLTFTVGISYLTSAIVGLGVGSYRAWQQTAKMQLLRGYRSANLIGKTASRFGNASASASLMYCLTGKIVDLVFEEEIQDFGNQARNTMAGAITGAMYKSTLGLRPMVVGSLFGAAFINVVSFSITSLNKLGVIKFNIDV